MNKRFKGIASMAAAGVLALALAGCGGGGAADSGSASTDKEPESSYKVTMVTDMGGVNDQSFNELAWKGLQQLEDETGTEVSYTESKQESDYGPNLDKAVDGENDLVWGIGFAMANAIETAAKQNPDVNFAIIDNAYENTPDNVTGVVFRAQEPSFLVGYIAAMTSQTGKVGFVGGMQSVVIDQFEWGYKAGVEYANKTQGKNVTVDVQYLESFGDAAKGKATATKMYSDGCDIVFHAAGGAGNGVIEAAKEAGKLVIGVDKDQSSLAPDNVLTSAMKNVDTAVLELSKKAIAGEEIGGTTVEFGMTEDAVGIPEEHPLMADEVYNQAIDLEGEIKDGKITPPANEDDFNAFVATL